MDLIGVAPPAELYGEVTAAPAGILERLPDEMRQKLPDELVDVASRFVSRIRVATDAVMPGGDEPGLVRCGALSVLVGPLAPLPLETPKGFRPPPPKADAFSNFASARGA